MQASNVVLVFLGVIERDLRNKLRQIQMDAAELVVGVQPRAEAWAQIDRKLVAQAAAIPFDWDKQPNIEASDVAGVGDLWNTGQWDYSYTSLK